MTTQTKQTAKSPKKSAHPEAEVAAEVAETPLPKPSFEEQLQLLQEIVQKLENTQLSLTESLQLYQQGLKLSQNCKQELKNINNEISLLNAQGQMEPYSL